MNPIVVLPVARPDYHLALKLLRWLRALADKAEFDSTYHLIVLCAKSLDAEHFEKLEVEIKGCEWVTMHWNPEAYERPSLGYAAGANHQFKAGLDAVDKLFPGSPMLWMEADCVPMRPSWYDEIAAEYNYALSLGRKVLGDFHWEGDIPHTIGCSVYPADWRECIPSFLTLPEPKPEWGWDSKSAHETVPLSHRSATIQQVWRAPHFTENNVKLVHPCTALFHQSKDGSLIDVLAKRLGIAPIPLSPAIAPPTSKLARARDGHSLPSEPTFKCEIFVVSYKKDMDFLRYCLKSIAMFSSGFSGVTLVVPASEKALYGWVPKGTKVLFHEEHEGKGHLDHLIAKLRADELCPHADAILYADSDCIFWEGFTPGDYFPEGKALMVRERYDELLNPNRLYWQSTVEKALGWNPDWECMVRHPQCHLRGVLKRTREIVEQHTAMKFDDYMLSGQSVFPAHACEFNMLGAVAIQEFGDKYHFVNYDRAEDARECRQDYNASWQHIYRRGRDKLAETWTHSGIGPFKVLLDKIMVGKAPEFYVK